VFDTQTSTWDRPSKESGVGVQPRSFHSCNLIGNNLVVYGGEGVDSQEQSLVVFDTEKMEWFVPEQRGQGPPEPRKGHVAAVHGNKLVVWGGWGTRVNQYLDDLWTFDFGAMSWAQAPKKGPVPPARGGACAVVFGKNFFVWGGWGAGPSTWNELHYVDTGDFTWLKRKPMGAVVPAERFYHAAVPVKENQLLIFGGQKEDKSFTNEAFILSTANVY